MGKATEKMPQSPETQRGDLCVCRCGKKTSMAAFYARTPDGYAFSRECFERYMASRAPMRAPTPNLAAS